METKVKLNYPLLYSIIFSISVVLFTAVLIGYGYAIFKEGLFKPLNGTGDYFMLLLNISLPLFFSIFIVIILMRFKFFFHQLELDLETGILNWRTFRKTGSIRIREILQIENNTTFASIKLYTGQTTLEIPKEINYFLVLYDYLKHQASALFPTVNNGFITTPGVRSRIVVTIISLFSIFPITIFFVIVPNFNGTENEWIGLFLILFFSIVIVQVLNRYLSKYKLEKATITKLSPLSKKVYNFIDFKELEIDEAQRTIIFTLEKNKLNWFEKLNGEKGLTIDEPGNISIEELYYFTANKMNQQNQP